MTTRDDQLSGWTKKKLQTTSQSLICTKKSSWSLFGGLVAHLMHYSFLNLGKTIKSERYTQQIDGMYQKLQCLQLALDNRKGPILLHDNAGLHVAQSTLQKFNKFGYEVLPHLPYSPGVSPNDSHFFKHLDNFLLGKMLPQPT